MKSSFTQTSFPGHSSPVTEQKLNPKQVNVYLILAFRRHRCLDRCPRSAQFVWGSNILQVRTRCTRLNHLQPPVWLTPLLNTRHLPAFSVVAVNHCSILQAKKIRLTEKAYRDRFSKLKEKIRRSTSFNGHFSLWFSYTNGFSSKNWIARKCLTKNNLLLLEMLEWKPDS